MPPRKSHHHRSRSDLARRRRETFCRSNLNNRNSSYRDNSQCGCPRPLSPQHRQMEGMTAAEEEQEGICPLLGRRRSASLPPLVTTTATSTFLLPRGAATPLPPPPLPMMATTPAPLLLPLSIPAPALSESMAIVPYQPPLFDAQRLRAEGNLASAAAQLVSEEKERRRKRRMEREMNQGRNAEGFERISEEGDGGEAMVG